MNGKILKKHKIDERYVLSEKKFLYTFGYLCLEQDLMENESLNKKQLYFFLEQRIEPACEEDVTLANVATGQIILVGRPNNFKAYHRPKIFDDIICNPQDEQKKEAVSISEMSYSQLIKKYYDSIDSDESFLYLDEFFARINHNKYKERDELSRKSENKVKCYMKK